MKLECHKVFADNALTRQHSYICQCIDSFVDWFIALAQFLWYDPPHNREEPHVQAGHPDSRSNDLSAIQISLRPNVSLSHRVGSRPYRPGRASCGVEASVRSD